MSEFTFIDLFAGIGGFHAALEGLGGRCVYAAEIDDDARAVYEEAWMTGDRRSFEFARDINADVPALEDVATIAELADLPPGAPGRIQNIPPFDVLAAGFPCQAFSKSGHQRGVFDEVRGTLFYNILRIIGERRPKVVFLENVRNLVGPNHLDTTFRTIIKALTDLDYLVSAKPTIMSPHRIPGSLGGGPQIRERVYIIAIQRDSAHQKSPFPGFVLPKDLAWEIAETPLADGAPAVITDAWLTALGDRERAEELRLLRGSETRNLSVADAPWLAPWRKLIEAAVRIGDEEARLGKGVSLFPGHPIWLKVHDSLWRAQQLSDANTFAQDWKKEFVDKSLQFLEVNKRALDESGALDAILKLDHNSWKKLEWQANDARSLDECLIQLRPSGIRVKKSTYAPALVAINQTPILGAEMRKLSPYEAGRLQGFPDRVYRAMEAVRGRGRKSAEAWDRAFYKQFGNAVHVGAVSFALTQFMAHHFPKDDPADLSLRALLNGCRTTSAWPGPRAGHGGYDIADQLAQQVPWIQGELVD